MTWGAGGSTSQLTVDICATAQTVYGLETCMHLTCTNMPREKIDVALTEAKLMPEFRTFLPCVAIRPEASGLGCRKTGLRTRRTWCDISASSTEITSALVWPGIRTFRARDLRICALLYASLVGKVTSMRAARDDDLLHLKREKSTPERTTS